MHRVLFSCFALAAAGTLAGAADVPKPAVLEGGGVRVEAGGEGGIAEHYFARRRDGKWIEITGSAGQTAGAVSIEERSGVRLALTSPSVRISGGSLVETFTAGGHQVTRTVSVAGDGWLRVVTRLAPSGVLELHSFYDRFRFASRPDWSYSPSVGGFNPDAQYKAPLILVQAGQSAFGIVPDVTRLDRALLERSSHALDLDVPAGPHLSAGYIPARTAFHSVFREDSDAAWRAEAPVENTYYLLVRADAEPGQAYREAVRFLWQQFARPMLASAAQQQAGTDPRYAALALWDDWRRALWDQESPAAWLQVPLPDGSAGGAVRMIRLDRPRPSLYFGAWFNSMRTAFGMALYARRSGKQDLLDRAGQTLNAALQAPGTEGAFKCIAVPSADGVTWSAGDGSGGSTRSGFLGFDMAWTGFWLLQWRAAHLPEPGAVLPRCERLADFLVARQSSEGMLPTRFDESGAVEQGLSRMVQAETGPVARFLLELYRQDRRPRYLDAARKGIAFLDRQVVPERKWYDFETFWSCSPRLISFDERTRQWPANNLALLHAVAAYLAAFEATGEKIYLARGEALLDYLLLFQQVWTNPRLEGLTGPAMLLGGFTTQNSDAEWSDARQSLCGNVLLDYYRATARAEYLERGVAALRAQFPISPSENWAHSGYGRKAGVSGFHWGSGSGMAGIEIEEDYLRDAACDIAARRCAGVNGLNVRECAVSGDRISLTIDSPFQWNRDPVLTFHGNAGRSAYSLVVNGRESGRFSWKDLEKGVPVPGFGR